MLGSFTVETFSGHVGEPSKIRPDASSSLEVELISAVRLGERSGERPFSMVFLGPRETLLLQRIYAVDHPEIGAFDLSP